MLSLELKYHSGNPVISAFERVSKPGRRIFSSADSLPKINNGLGIVIVSIPKSNDWYRCKKTKSWWWNTEVF